MFAFLGSEGGIVYSRNSQIIQCSDILGLVIAPLCWKSNELIGLTICASFDLVVRGMLATLNQFDISKKLKLSWIPDMLSLEELIASVPKTGKNKLVVKVAYQW